MANKFDGDVRPLSNDPRYMGVVFEGLMADAIQQAHDAPDHGLSEQRVPKGVSRNRAALLEHLNILPPELSKYSNAYATSRGWGLALDPEPVYGAPVAPTLAERFAALTPQQVQIYGAARVRYGVHEALAIAKAYPYPAPREVS